MPISNHTPCWMAYSQNGTPLMNAPTTRDAARKKAEDYTFETRTPAYTEVIES